MSDADKTCTWQPVAQTERYAALDVIRGVALLGVLLVNLLDDFRVPLAEHILTFHTHPDWKDRAVDVLVAALLEFKAFALFTLLFGVGLAVFAERAAVHRVQIARFLARRLLVLLAIGLCHMLLIWNGDILSLYSVCGLLLVPLLRLHKAVLAAMGLAVVCLSFIIPLNGLWPTETTLRDLAAEAAQVYTRGSLAEVVSFHWRETKLLIIPLLAASLLKTWGLMALGAAAWRAGILREPKQHRVLLGTVALFGGVIGGSTTVASVYSDSTGLMTWAPPLLIEAGSFLPLALAFAVGLLLALQSPCLARAARPFAALGQMALTNYLMQSVVLSLLFYGYGLGLHGRLGSAAAVVIGLTVYATQMAFCQWWLLKYRFGPVEWLWRSLTYGRRQPM
jgi:uncharacterized protein